MELSDTRHESFARLVAASLAVGRKPNYAQAAIQAGYGEISSANRGSRLAKAPRIAERIEELRATQQAIEHSSDCAPGLDTPAERVAAMRGRWRDLYAIVAARGKDPLYARVPGGRSGFLMRTGRSAFRLDTDLLRELRAIEERVSEELRQSYKSVGVCPTSVSVILTDPVGLNRTLREQFGNLSVSERAKVIDIMPELAEVLEPEPEPPAE